MARNLDVKKGFLARLLRSEAGNTLALTAAATVPLVAMIGGAVDISRAYLAKSRLQQACDAGALAGRRQMGIGIWNTAADTAAKNFFDTNYQSGSYGTTGLSRSFSEASQVVTGTASVTVPNALMKIFGYTGKTIAVNCVAEMKIPNTDVMFVLDTTGSMAQYASSSDTQTKIVALRSAVQSFYTTLESAKGVGTQIRYGFVPYSVNVNVGYLLNRDWMVDTATYQSRVAKFTGTYVTSSSNWTYVSGSYSSSTSKKQPSCPTNTYAYNDATSSSTSTDSYGNTVTVTTTTRTANGSQYSCSGGKSGYTVVQDKYTNYVSQKTDTNYPRYTWLYKPVSYDVSGMKGTNSDGLMAGGSITANVGALTSSYQPTSKTVTWNGCIEERQTIATSTYTTVPTGANMKDLDIDAVPSISDDTTRWKPALAGLVFGRQNVSSNGSLWNLSNVQADTEYYSPSGPCPAEAMKLTEIDSTSLTTYLNSLNPTGNTYHDIGMLWGARLISPTGLFAAENATTPSGAPITRHIIFMTDGTTQPDGNVYTPYGLEPLDVRRTTSSPTDADLTNVVNARLDSICTAVKNKNITIWVVAFGTTLTSNLSSCASPGRAYQANNAAALNTAFNDIAAQISQLRLTQ